MKKSLNQVLRDALVGKKVDLYSLTDLDSDRGIIVEITDCEFDEKGGDDDDKFIYYRLPGGDIQFENMDWSDELDFVD